MKIIYDKDSGRSRGFGFVHFSKEDHAKCAKDAMDGKVSKELWLLKHGSDLLIQLISKLSTAAAS